MLAIRHAAAVAVCTLPVAMVETALGTLLMAGPGNPQRPATTGRPAARRAVGMPPVTRGADGEQAVQCRQVFWRSGWSTALERARRAPTGQRAGTVAQRYRPARSVGARGGHEGPVAPGPSPHAESASTVSERPVACEHRRRRDSVRSGTGADDDPSSSNRTAFKFLQKFVSADIHTVARKSRCRLPAHFPKAQCTRAPGGTMGAALAARRQPVWLAKAAAHAPLA